MQIQALLAEEAVARGREGRGGATEVAKPQIFDSTLSKISGFISVYKLYIRMKLREESVEGQIQWILSYVQGGAVDIWKENVLEDLEAGEFLIEIKKEFRGEDKESVRVAKLKRIEQGNWSMEEFVQDFKRVVRSSGYEGQLLIEEFKRGMNGAITRKLMEVKNQLGSIEQWFKRATALNRNWRESKREEERLRG